MKKTLISKGIFAESLRRLKAVCIIFAALSLITGAIPPVFEVFTNNIPESSARDVVSADSICYFLPTLSFILPILVIMILFAPFNRRTYSDFAHSLPYTRQCIFLTKVLAAFITTVLLLGFSTFVSYISYAIFSKYFILNLSGLGTVILTNLSVAAFISACLLIAVSLTGTVLSNITATALLMFFPRFIIAIISETVINEVPFLCSGVPFLSAEYNTCIGLILYSVGLSMNYAEALAPAIYTLIVSAVYFIFALIIFKFRKSETAEQPAPGKVVQCIIRVMVALVFTVPAVVLFSGTDDLMLSIMLCCIGVVAYFTYEIITTRRWKNVVRAIPALLIVAAVSGICVLAVNGIISITGNYSPEASQIDSVRLEGTASSASGGGYCDDDWRTTLQYLPSASEIDLTDKEVCEIVADALNESVSKWKEGKIAELYNNKYVVRKVVIKQNGIERTRKIYMKAETNDLLLSKASQTKDFKNAYMNLPEALEGTFGAGSLDITGLSEKDIIASLEKEIEKMGFEKFYNICENGDGALVSSADCTEISYVPVGYKSATVDFVITAETFPETFNLLLKNTVDRQNPDILKDFVEKAKEDKYQDLYLNVDIKFDGKYYLASLNNYADESMQDSKLAELIEKAVSEDNAVDADRIMYINYYGMSCDVKSGKEYYNNDDGIMYLPVPKDFNPADYPELDEAEYTDEKGTYVMQ